MSENAASDFLLYQAVDKVGNIWLFSISMPHKQTKENNAIKQSGLLAIALSDHWRWVSTPKCARASSKATSMFQRRTNHCTICSGDSCKSVLRNASASFLWGSNTKTQRIGNGFSPEEHHR